MEFGSGNETNLVLQADAEARFPYTNLRTKHYETVLPVLLCIVFL